MKILGIDEVSDDEVIDAEPVDDKPAQLTHLPFERRENSVLASIPERLIQIGAKAFGYGLGLGLGRALKENIAQKKRRVGTR